MFYVVEIEHLEWTFLSSSLTLFPSLHTSLSVSWFCWSTLPVAQLGRRNCSLANPRFLAAFNKLCLKTEGSLVPAEIWTRRRVSCFGKLLFISKLLLSSNSKQRRRTFEHLERCLDSHPTQLTNPFHRLSLHNKTSKIIFSHLADPIADKIFRRDSPFFDPTTVNRGISICKKQADVRCSWCFRALLRAEVSGGIWCRNLPYGVKCTHQFHNLSFNRCWLEYAGQKARPFHELSAQPLDTWFIGFHHNTINIYATFNCS